MFKSTLIVLFCIGAASVAEAVSSERIIGGFHAKEGQFPFQISLRRFGGHFCGGAIITQKYILTAAHCVGEYLKTNEFVPFAASDISIRAGSIDNLKGGVIIDVEEIIVHEEFSDFLNDVALLLLKEPLIYSAEIQPIQLATSEVPAGKTVIISGWGRTEEVEAPRMLKWNKLIALNRQQCAEAIYMDSDSLLCLSHEANNGACNGDSGGPAVYNNELVGIAGFVFGDCGTSLPDGYAKVFYHIDWIRKHLYLD